jgi:hypothetical protein
VVNAHLNNVVRVVLVPQALAAVTTLVLTILQAKMEKFLLVGLDKS